ncbi:serine protease 42 [Drosophila suzukii]|uniref:Serine protease 42 n=1 Tax=Drosophila suzukii TaxID=28584 RepID=A0AB39ZPI0_DROSZ
MSPLQLVTALLVISLIESGLGQLPRNGCAPRFEYQGYQGQYIGLVKVRHPLVSNQSLILQFSQPGYHDFTDNVGKISMVDTDETTQNNLRNGFPIRYRVDFPIPTIPPKITGMQVNGIELCGGVEYPKPRTGITLLITWVTYGVSLVPSPGVYRESEPTQPRIPDRGEDIWRSNESIPTFSNPGWSTATQQATPNRNTVAQDLNINPNRGTVPQQRINNPVRPTAPQQTIRNTDPPQTFRNNEERVSQETASSEEYPCGRERRQKTITSPLIYQGTSLERGQLPWLVAIFERRESNGPRFICGGSLISTSTVLSAAHCFRVPGKDLPADRLAISLGRNTLAIHSPGEYRGVSQLIIHDKFNVAQFTEADLALVRLDSPVGYYDYVIPICLWSPRNQMELPQGHKTYVAGWGPDESGNGHSDVAKVTDLNIVIESSCRLELAKELVQPSSLCAKRVGAGPCTSDGGGPLMLKEQDVWVLRGVTSAGQIDEEKGTCDHSLPSVFTDVAKHIDWVRRNMWN